LTFWNRLYWAEEKHIKTLSHNLNSFINLKICIAYTFSDKINLYFTIKGGKKGIGFFTGVLQPYFPCICLQLSSIMSSFWMHKFINHKQSSFIFSFYLIFFAFVDIGVSHSITHFNPFLMGSPSIKQNMSKLFQFWQKLGIAKKFYLHRQGLLFDLLITINPKSGFWVFL